MKAKIVRVERDDEMIREAREAVSEALAHIAELEKKLGAL